MSSSVLRVAAADLKRPKLRLTAPTQRQIERATRPKEVQVQCAYVAWCRRLAHAQPELARGFHAANGEERDVRVANKLKQMGVRPGVLDWCLPVARGGFHGAFIEFKRPGEKPTEEQSAEIARLRADGYAVEVFADWLAAAEWTLAYVRGQVRC